jgi:hypothetical protein
METATEMVARDQRNDQDSGRGPEAGRREQREPGDRGHDPAVVEAFH